MANTPTKTSNSTPLNFQDTIQTLGRYEVHTIETGTFGLDGGAMFGIIPKTIWSKTNPSDELNRIDMRLRCLLLIERDSTQKIKRAILIDNGIGKKWNDKFSQIYKIDHTRFSLESELAKKGLKTTDITDLIGTHLHFDHMGGTTTIDKDGSLRPTFENAKLWIQNQNWNLAYHPNDKDKASYLKENYDVYQGSNKLQLLDTTYGTREEILPGIFVRVSNGHTPGLQMVEVADDPIQSLIYCADAIPTSSHIKIPFIMGYDCFPLTMIDEKKALLYEAQEKKMILFFEHCPNAQAATVKHDGKDFVIETKYV
jgi:glyoxylase-like metal-dependent hydrolase (beta-lactamase superfamily II)